MARLMSVAYTEDAVRARTKTVTRRKGWWVNRRGDRILLPGQQLTLCRKVMGRKAGEPLERIVDVEVVDVRRERLGVLLGCDADGRQYGRGEVAREGFPGMDPAEFVRRFFTDAQGIHPDHEVTRIEWRYLDNEAPLSEPGTMQLETAPCTSCGQSTTVLERHQRVDGDQVVAGLCPGCYRLGAA